MSTIASGMAVVGVVTIFGFFALSIILVESIKDSLQEKRHDM